MSFELAFLKEQKAIYESYLEILKIRNELKALVAEDSTKGGEK